MAENAPEDMRVEPPAFVRRSRYSEELGVHVRADGPVSHLAAKSLERPLDMPKDEFRKVIYIAAVAVLIAAISVFSYNSIVMADKQEAAAKVEDVINRGVGLDLPSLQDYAGRSNDDILNSIREAGYPLFDNTSEEDTSVGGFDVYKLASDVTPEEAADAYARGLENIEPTEAAKVISGSWRLLMERSAETEMRLRYVDFAATTETTAINDALNSQHLDASAASEVTKDSAGNSNVSGTFEKDGKTYSYTISVCDVTQMYEIEGVPQHAQFVGIRVTG